MALMLIVKLFFMAALAVSIYLTAKMFKYDKKGDRIEQIEEQFMEEAFRRSNR